MAKKIALVSAPVALLIGQVSAQWGAVASPPEFSCGNHFDITTAGEQPSLDERLQERKDDLACAEYGKFRTQTENMYFGLDTQDATIKKVRRSRNKAIRSVR